LSQVNAAGVNADAQRMDGQQRLNALLEAGLQRIEIALPAGVELGFGMDLLGGCHACQSDEGDWHGVIPMRRRLLVINSQYSAGSDSMTSYSSQLTPYRTQLSG
jgi:hypothetical protein